MLWTDFVQTVLKGALAGYVIGCGAAFLVGIAVDRAPFLRRGLLPVGNFVAALPIIGMAPIMVMWFGFDWQSKAAVVVLMVLLPDAGEHGAGLAATDAMQAGPDAHLRRDHWQTSGQAQAARGGCRFSSTA